jgi:hypothetical protein
LLPERLPRFHSAKDQLLQESERLHQVGFARTIRAVKDGHGQGLALVIRNRRKVLGVVGIPIARDHRQGLFFTEGPEVGDSQGEEHDVTFSHFYPFSSEFPHARRSFLRFFHRIFNPLIASPP